MTIIVDVKMQQRERGRNNPQFGLVDNSLLLKEYYKYEQNKETDYLTNNKCFATYDR